MTQSIDYLLAKTKINELAETAKSENEQTNLMYKVEGMAKRALFGFDVSINHNPEHPYAPYPSVVIYEVDKVNKDWCHAIHADESGKLVITKITPDMTQQAFVDSVIESHAEDEAIHNRW